MAALGIDVDRMLHASGDEMAGSPACTRDDSGSVSAITTSCGATSARQGALPPWKALLSPHSSLADSALLA